MIAAGAAFMLLIAGWVMALSLRVADARELGVRVEASTSAWLAQLDIDIREIKEELREIRKAVAALK